MSSYVELRDMCVEHFKDDLNKVNDINECIFSIPGRLRMIQYHREMANTSLRKAMPDLSLEQCNNILLTAHFYYSPHLSEDDKKKIPESESKLFPRLLDARFDGLAHLDSLITNLHMSSELLSYLIFTVFDLGILAHQVSIDRVIKRLDEDESPIYLNNLKKALIDLKNSRYFKYVSSYTNVSKHRMLLQVCITADVTDYIKVNSFKYRNESYEEKFITGITGELYQGLTDEISTVGIEINRAFKHVMSLKS